MDHLQLCLLWFPLQFIDLSFVFVWPLNQFHSATVYWLVFRDRNSPLCHIRASLTPCIGAGHIIFFAGIDSTGHQVTHWNSTFTFVFFLVCLHSFYVCCNFPLFSFSFRSVFFGLCFFLFFGLFFWQISFAEQTITFLRITYSLQAACVAVAALMQYFLMASFCRMLVEGIYIYLFVLKVYNITNKMHHYHGFCWGKEDCEEMRKMG